MRTTFLLCLLLLAHSMHSQPVETFQLIRYSPPAGWTVSSQEWTRQYTHAGANSFCVLTLYTSSYSAGSALADFREEWQTRVLSIASAQQVFEPMTGSLPSGLEFIQSGATITMNNGANMYAHLMVIRMGDKRQSLVFGFPTPAAVAVYEKDIQQLLGSINRAEDSNPATGGEKTTTVTPGSEISSAKANQGIFYHGMELVLVGFGQGNHPRYLYLFPDNSFQWGYYQRGYYNYNKAMEQKTSPGYCGTYTHSGNLIRLNFQDNSGYRPEFKMDEKGNLHLNSQATGYTLLKFSSLNDRTLTGTYAKEDSNPNTWGGARPMATFYADGRFDDKGLLCMGESLDNSTPGQDAQRMNENKTPGKGSYRIVDHSLLLTYDDGRKRQLLIYIYEKDAGKTSPELLVVANMPFVLMK